MDWNKAKNGAAKVGRFAGKAALFVGKAAVEIGTAAVVELVNKGVNISNERSNAENKTDSELLRDIKGSDFDKKVAAAATLKDRGYTKDDIHNS